ncbi:MAG: gluconolaconase [Novosphingobium sp.]
MVEQSGRYTAPAPATSAEGWRLERLTRPSRLFGANGIRTGKDGRIYVAQVAGSQVSAIDPMTGAIETISPTGGGITAPDDLAFDDDGNLYCTEITSNRVSVLRPNGRAEIIAADIFVANPITVHQNRVIAGELRMGGRILELDRNGGAPRVIYEGVPMANAFDVGPDGKLYFPAQGVNEIWRIDLAGGEPEVVARNLGVPDSVKFHPDGYIVSTQVFSGQVLKIDPRTGDTSVLADIGPGLDNVTFVGNRIFVSHITGSIHEIVAPGDARPLIDKGLQWPMGLAVNPDGTVYVGDGMFAYAVAPGREIEQAGMLFGSGFPGFVRGVASSGAREWIVTTANGTVARWTPGEPAETLAHGFEIPIGVALSASAIIFADAGAGRVLSLENGEVTELAAGIDKPTGVAVSGDGTVYVSQPDAGRIVKLVGGKSTTVLDGLSWPEGIAIRGDRLYAADTGAKSLVEIDLTTGAQRALASNLPIGTPHGVPALRPSGVGDMCGPMNSFTGVAAGADGALYVSGDAEGSVLALRPA